ncbi:glycoside hydrolase superfamily [Hypoxylon sp. FL1857]|nr:glycoside hydrolase superfamily [Hypoxylon sp. FL1857]
MDNTPIPHLVKTGPSTQLVVRGKPFLMLPGTLQSSALTSADYMDTVWQKLKDSNANTLVGCVTWEMIEPVEGEFDFSELSKVILNARRHGFHLVLVWLGLFKNGFSTCVPSWVKTNPRRFPRAKVRGRGVPETADSISIFYQEGLKAATTAFVKFMEYIKDIDETYSTVLMVGVEHGPGLQRGSRDTCAAANESFAEEPPKDLIQFLQDKWDTLHPHLTRIWNLERKGNTHASYAGQSWEQVFGKDPMSNLVFMAYHYARYLDEIAAAGKAVYPIPMYTTAWINQDGQNIHRSYPILAGSGAMAGAFPSGCPISDGLYIWQKFAPNLDFISPDLYLEDYAELCADYCHGHQPLFIPEQRRDDYASPSAIDMMDPQRNPFAKHFGLLNSVSTLVLEAQRTPGSSVGFCFDEGPDFRLRGSKKPVVRRWGDFEITIEPSSVFGEHDLGAGMVIHRGGAVFLLIGWGFKVRAKSLSPNATFTGILRFEEKEVVDRETGELKTQRRLNGGETMGGPLVMMPPENPGNLGHVRFPVCIPVPVRTMIAELEVYALTEDDE